MTRESKLLEHRKSRHGTVYRPTDAVSQSFTTLALLPCAISVRCTSVGNLCLPIQHRPSIISRGKADRVSVAFQSDEQNKKPKPQIPGSWPPPIPTHPPDHTLPALPTHPPYVDWTTISAGKPVFTTKKPGVATTWPTKKPAWWPGAPIATSTEKPSGGGVIPIDASKCGAKNGNQDQKRIVGGRDADPGEWPWIAALFNAGRQFCGGSLIDETHILTAAHCVVK